ncbi:dTMP kinase [Corynebacterium sp. zg254]|uniref:Thymidylate kinase n=1 Tax=Corynebacterium zhongnanshanii TaxID=2768834 RepID=A0ABQ6VKH5_9CORY|nr:MULTISPECIES: dTMP kinase [Corynebacterium]KAB3522976.1 dTMP kinase [Corynebacterium zhongnanshanii]MCR5913941.1 dTMP kinase [Corynebacterium sp. zg254]
MIISFEGVDGAGKNTLVTAVEAELIRRELPVARLAFPRYEHSVHAHLAQQGLYQKMGDLTDSIYGMATLFALDRHEVADELSDLDADGYVILLDRYAASNAAYSAARITQREGTRPGDMASHSIVEWVDNLEFATLGVPVPDLQILVDVSAQLAHSRVASREADDEDRVQDAYEADRDLQERTVQAYRDLAAAHWRSPWTVVDFSGADVTSCAEDIADSIQTLVQEDN